ncbi:LacI family DNA-binding transcriptional regulator [Paenarthrobacter sp. GOM3]|uniref:LacI family DNA-binding transcriptional regulator n=1 Tax=Paenarthrobacter sp. GOM3 TaxID=2782567 RepID=UPI001BAA97BF|nr:LacI family DNA-binding transcriptional regulator [Paenarthrobacter sp. GOM3]WOH19542.1 LacI family DNA-binding transcriptional regulator [Paenarthrobacter sp. GOM3]
MARGEGITIRDVAQRAGVSITAVSHSLNGKGTISEATRARVKAAADELGYQADAFARGMRQGSIGAIGLVLRSLDALGDYTPAGVDVFERFVGIVSAKALAKGLSITLVPDLSRQPVPPLAFSMDGYIIMSPHENDPVAAILDKRGIPYVCYGKIPGRQDFIHWASEDDPLAARQLLAHFETAGARDVVLVPGSDRNSWNQDFLQEYLVWCHAHGVKPRVYEQAERTGVDGGRDAGRRILADGVPEAVLCLTGRHAAGVQLEFLAAGIAIPGQVMIAAASDSEHSRSSRPAITAFELNPADCADALLDMLQELLKTGQAPGPRLTKARLRPRASSRRD